MKCRWMDVVLRSRGDELIQCTYTVCLYSARVQAMKPANSAAFPHSQSVISVCCCWALRRSLRTPHLHFHSQSLP